jgi:hypothetical protein
MSRLDKLLDEYEGSLGLAPLRKSDQEHRINEYLQYSRDDLAKIDREACAGIAYEVASYGFHLQRAINRQKSRISFCEAELRKELAAILPEFRHIFSWEERRWCATQSNSYTQKLQDLKERGEQRLARLDGIHFSLKNIIDVLKTLSYSKRDDQ